MDTDDKEVSVLKRANRRLCYCPIEGCTSRPLSRLSNHLSQVHHLSRQERAKYLHSNRRFATTREVKAKVKKIVLCRSEDSEV